MTTFAHVPARHPLLIALALLASVTAVCAAEPLKVGDTVPALQARDQHDKDFTLEDDAQWLLIAFDMGTGKAANGWLARQGADWLPGRKAVFVSNILGMPGVGRVFALPKMRRYPHRIILADEQGLLDAFPAEPDKVTVLKLAPGRKITAITYWQPRDDKAPFPP